VTITLTLKTLIILGIGRSLLTPHNVGLGHQIWLCNPELICYHGEGCVVYLISDAYRNQEGISL